MLNELYAFEQNEKVEERTRIDLERRFRVRVETRLALEEQLMDQFKRKLQVMEDDKVFLGKQMEMMAERDKIDQMSNERRRRKMAEHRKDIHELLENRKQQRVLDIANEIKLQELEQKKEARKYVLLFLAVNKGSKLFNKYLFPSLTDKKSLRKNALKC